MHIESLTILGGTDKEGVPEYAQTTVRRGETCCLVGPTGAGKSRLLADIEWLAQGDTPSCRRILLDGQAPSAQMRDGLQGKLVAQITQNMNFVLDMSVQEFMELHADSQGITQAVAAAAQVIACANQLCGERFAPDTPLTFLSGGQSRALMIADVACLGQTPIVLIDEIENAGIDKIAALRLFADRKKIVLLASHDPLLILQADFRIAIQNGGIAKLVRPTPAEALFLEELRVLEARQGELRTLLRRGESLV
jgi:ABC-type lipoprotein export system ATPase subunit